MFSKWNSESEKFSNSENYSKWISDSEKFPNSHFVHLCLCSVYSNMTVPIKCLHPKGKHRSLNGCRHPKCKFWNFSDFWNSFWIIFGILKIFGFWIPFWKHNSNYRSLGHTDRHKRRRTDRREVWNNYLVWVKLGWLC